MTADHADVAAAAMLRIVADHIAAPRYGDGLFDAVAAYIRDEFASIRQQTLNEIRLTDE